MSDFPQELEQIVCQLASDDGVAGLVINEATGKFINQLTQDPHSGHAPTVYPGIIRRIRGGPGIGPKGGWIRGGSGIAPLLSYQSIIFLVNHQHSMIHCKTLCLDWKQKSKPFTQPSIRFLQASHTP